MGVDVLSGYLSFIVIFIYGFQRSFAPLLITVDASFLLTDGMTGVLFSNFAEF